MSSNGGGDPDAPNLTLVAGVEVVELELADDEADEQDEPLEVSELPSAIVAALKARYPGGELVEAEREYEGDELEYDVVTRFEGHTIEVSLTPDGVITEMSQVLSTDELPSEVVDWVLANFAGAVIGEAERVEEGGLESYELVITTPGSPVFEATLRVPGATDPGDPAAQADSPGIDPARTWSQAVTEPRREPVELPTSGESGSGAPRGEEAEGDVIEPAESTEQVESPSPPDDAGLDGRGGAGIRSIDDIRNIRGPGVGTAVEALRVGLMATLPETFGVLGEAVAFDSSPLQRALDEMLGSIDGLADVLAIGTVVAAGDNRAAGVAIGATLAAGAYLILFNSRRPKQAASVSHCASDTTWSWVIGMATPRDRQTPWNNEGL